MHLLDESNDVLKLLLQVVEALGLDEDTYQAFVSAPLCSEPLISCSRFHHSSAVLLGSAAHATFPDMHVSASAGLEVGTGKACTSLTGTT